MLPVVLSILKYVLIATGSALGIFGVTTGFKSAGQVTSAVRIAIGARRGIAGMTIATAVLEQYASHAATQQAIEKERLGRKLSDLALEWKLTDQQIQAFSDEVERYSKTSQNVDTSWFRYIATA